MELEVMVLYMDIAGGIVADLRTSFGLGADGDPGGCFCDTKLRCLGGD